MFEIIPVGTARFLCSGFSCVITLGSVNPVQSLYFPVAVPQCALQTTLVVPLQNVCSGSCRRCGRNRSPVRKSGESRNVCAALHESSLPCWWLVTPRS